MSYTLKQLTAHLWAAQSRLFHTNIGVFLSAGQACLIDPGVYPDEIEALRGFLAEQQAQAKFVVITHSHWDHVLGPEHFAGVPIVTQANYAREISSPEGAAALQEIAQWEQKTGIERTQTFAFPIPNRTFAQTMTLALGEITLKLAHAPGHAADALVVYQASSGILWAGDMLSDMEIPYVSDNLDAYLRTLDMLSRWQIQVLVPGHGSPTSDAQEIHGRLFEDIAYLTTLRDKVPQAIRMGKTVEETVELCRDMPFREAEANAGPHQLNVESAYLELGGESETPYLGWDRFLDPEQ
ncbi:MAG: MBL fold metallo-hydrolase [Chloroflexia bacterium]|nr:MBL fold metallo-hydrolase [Chloroflexia bacterium]